MLLHHLLPQLRHLHLILFLLLAEPLRALLDVVSETPIVLLHASQLGLLLLAVRAAISQALRTQVLREEGRVELGHDVLQDTELQVSVLNHFLVILLVEVSLLLKPVELSLVLLLLFFDFLLVLLALLLDVLTEFVGLDLHVGELLPIVLLQLLHLLLVPQAFN